MAKGESIDPLDFTRLDKDQGARLVEDPTGLVRSVDRNGVQRWRRKGRMAGGIRDRILMAQMKAGMAALWANGETYPEIAERISDYYDLQGDQRLSAHGIKYHIGNMLSYWRQKGLALMDERQAVVLTRLDQIEALALEGYFASMEGKTTTHVNKKIEKARSRDRQSKMQSKRAEKRAKTKSKLTDNLFIDTGELVDIGDVLDVVAEKSDKSKRFESNAAGDPKFLNILITVNDKRAKILGLYNQATNLNGDQEAAKLTDEQRNMKIATILSAAKERQLNRANMLADPAPLGGFETIEGEEVQEVPEEDEGWGFDEEELDEEIVEEDDTEWD